MRGALLAAKRVVFFIGIPPRLFIVFGMLIVNFGEFIPELVRSEQLVHAFRWEGANRDCPVFIDSRRECFCLSHLNDVASIY